MVQDPKKLKVYQEAFSLSVDVYRRLKDSKTSLRLKEQLFGSVSSICANLAEMGAFESKAHQKHKLLTCLGESNEAEFWFDFCKEAEVLNQKECVLFIQRLISIRKMLYSLLRAIKEDIKNNNKEG